MEQAVSTLTKPLKLLLFTPAETSACGVLGRSSSRVLNIMNIFLVSNCLIECQGLSTNDSSLSLRGTSATASLHIGDSHLSEL